MILLINSCIINCLTNVKDKNHHFLHMSNNFYCCVSRTWRVFTFILKHLITLLKSTCCSRLFRVVALSRVFHPEGVYAFRLFSLRNPSFRNPLLPLFFSFFYTIVLSKISCCIFKIFKILVTSYGFIFSSQFSLFFSNFIKTVFCFLPLDKKISFMHSTYARTRTNLIDRIISGRQEMINAFRFIQAGRLFSNDPAGTMIDYLFISISFNGPWYFRMKKRRH